MTPAPCPTGMLREAEGRRGSRPGDFGELSRAGEGTDILRAGTAIPRVLIVDDQPAFRAQLRRLLTVAGFYVVGEAGDIPEAEVLVSALRPDLAVVDVMLPGISGLDGVPRLKASAPGLRVIVVSAHRDQAHIFRDAAVRAGAERFVQKDDLDFRAVTAWLSDGEAAED